MEGGSSAIPDCGGLLKRLSVQLAGMSASNFSEPSLSTRFGSSTFSKGDARQSSNGNQLCFSNTSNCSIGTVLPNKYPCSKSSRFPKRNFRCSSISTPSAMTSKFSLYM